MNKFINLNNDKCVVCGGERFVLKLPEVLTERQQQFFNVKEGYQFSFTLCERHHKECRLEGSTEHGFPNTQLLIDAIRNAVDTFDWKPIQAEFNAIKKEVKDRLKTADAMLANGQTPAGTNMLTAALRLIDANEGIETPENVTEIRLRCACMKIEIYKSEYLNGSHISGIVKLNELAIASQMLKDCKEYRSDKFGRDSIEVAEVILKIAEVESIRGFDKEVVGIIEPVLNKLFGNRLAKAYELLALAYSRGLQSAKKAEEYQVKLFEIQKLAA